MQYVQYFDIIMIEWLASKISLLGKGYGDRKIHKNELRIRRLGDSLSQPYSSDNV